MLSLFAYAISTQISYNGLFHYKPLSHIWDDSCRDNPNSAYAISSFPPTGHQSAKMITESHAFAQREVIMPSMRH